MWWIYQMISLSLLLVFGPLRLDPGSDNYWDPCWTTSLKWGGCYTYSGTWTSTALMWNPCPPPTHSSWYPSITWRVRMMSWSRGWIDASEFLNNFFQKWTYCSSVLKSAGWIWGYCVWTGTSSCFPYYILFLSILPVCHFALLSQWKITLRHHHLGFWKCMQTLNFVTWAWNL